jgi:hypothetical protein
VAAASIRAIQDSRRSLRYPTSFSGELIVRHKKALPVMISNISRCGALIKGCDLPMAGHEVVLRARSLDVVATVAWTGIDFAGLRFHRDVEPLEVVRQNADELRLFRTMRAHASLKAGLLSGWRDPK